MNRERLLRQVPVLILVIYLTSRNILGTGGLLQLFGLESGSVTFSNVMSALSSEDERQSTIEPSLQEPVIVLGFPKSGTTSVYQYFNCSGLRTQHYCARGDLNDHPPCAHGTMGGCLGSNLIKINKGMNTSFFEGCGEYQVYAQIDVERKTVRRKINGTRKIGVMSDDGKWIPTPTRLFFPQHFNLDKIHEAFPNATYILTIRDPIAWASSVTRWFSLRAYIFNEYKQQGEGERFGIGMGRNLTGQLTRIFEDHIAMVRQFCRDHPSHRLVEVNISSETAGQELAEVFPKTDASCWKQANKNIRKPGGK